MTLDWDGTTTGLSTSITGAVVSITVGVAWITVAAFTTASWSTTDVTPVVFSTRSTARSLAASVEHRALQDDDAARLDFQPQGGAGHLLVPVDPLADAGKQVALLGGDLPASDLRPRRSSGCSCRSGRGRDRCG